MKVDENYMENVVRYIDSIVTTVNPEINAPKAERHPCQKRPDEIDNGIQDYTELINKLQ